MPETQKKTNYRLGWQKEQHMLVSKSSRTAENYKETAPRNATLSEEIYQFHQATVPIGSGKYKSGAARPQP